MVFPAKRLCVVPSMEGVRWAFSCGTWLPSRAEWLLAVRSIQPEEKERIGQFVFARDAKAALVLEAFGIGRGGWGGAGRRSSTQSRVVVFPELRARVGPRNARNVVPLCFVP